MIVAAGVPPAVEGGILPPPPIGQTRRLVAHPALRDKPAVSPTSKSARRWESHSLRVWKPATSPERLRGTQTWKSALQGAVPKMRPSSTG